MPINYSAIAQKIEEGQIDKALQLADEALKSSPADAQVLYLKGQAHQADGNAAAAQAEEMLNGIMDFYNKDMYNQ